MADPISIDLTVTKDTTEEGFELTFAVNQAVSVSQKIFVIKREDDSYDRVANIWDLITDPLPDTPTDGIPYYRTNEFTLVFTFEERDQADAYELIIPEKVNRLAELLNLDQFVGTSTETYPT